MDSAKNILKTLRRGEKMTEKFKNLCSRVAKCRKCFKNFTMQKFYTFFDGSLISPLLIVGQSPIYPLPIEKTRPFSLMDDNHQHAGSRWLRECFEKANLNYRNCYLTNLVKDSAKDNKVEPEMINNCSEFLEEEIKLFRGKIILAFGTPCCKYFNVKPNDSKYNETGKIIFGSRHPSYLMRNGESGKLELIEILKNIKYLIESPKTKSLEDF